MRRFFPFVRMVKNIFYFVVSVDNQVKNLLNELLDRAQFINSLSENISVKLEPRHHKKVPRQSKQKKRRIFSSSEDDSSSSSDESFVSDDKK